MYKHRLDTGLLCLYGTSSTGFAMIGSFLFDNLAGFVVGLVGGLILSCAHFLVICRDAQRAEDKYDARMIDESMADVKENGTISLEDLKKHLDL